MFILYLYVLCIYGCVSFNLLHGRTKIRQNILPNTNDVRGIDQRKERERKSFLAKKLKHKLLFIQFFQLEQDHLYI